MSRFLLSFILFVLLLTSYPGYAADPWSRQDIGLEVGYQLLHVIDWGQTRQIAKQPDKYYEMNPILGEHPSVGRVDAYMALSGLLHVGVTHFLPKEYRPWFQGITIVIKGGLVAHNFSIGLGVSF